MTIPMTDNMRGALFMTAAMAGFGLNDAAMKAVLVDLPLMPAIAIRGAFMVVVIGLLCVATGAFRWRAAGRDARLIGWRAFAEMGATIAFLTALSKMPIANATAILQAAPLAVTLAAALFLAEPVGWRRGLALVIGFMGVMLIVRPGTEAFNAFALFALVAVGFIVLRDLTTRRLSPGVPTLVVSFVTSVALTLLGGIASLFQAPVPVDAPALGLIAVASGFLIVGYVFSVRTMRVGEISFVAPFRYTILLFAMVLGVVFFDDFPDALTLLGAALVVGTGVFTFWREQRLARRGAMPISAEVRTR